jgi:hypothetical protein
MSASRERFARLGPIQVIPRVRSGSRVDAVIRPAGKPAHVHTVYAIHASMRWLAPTKAAMAAIQAGP